MRALEALLLGSQVLVAGVLVAVAARHQATLSARASVAVPPSVFGLSFVALLVQLVAEGYRWQLGPSQCVALPLQALSVLLLLLRQAEGANARALSAAALVLAACSLVATAVSALLCAVLPVFRLPRPTGPHAVSALAVEFEDPTRPEWVAPWSHDPKAPRRLLVKIWYPAQLRRQDKADGSGGGGVSSISSSSAGQPGGRCSWQWQRLVHQCWQRAASWWRPDYRSCEYFAHLHLRASSLSVHHGVPRFLLAHLGHVRSSALLSAAGEPLPLSGARAAFPVLIYSHGFSACHDIHTALLEELASHGFVVAAVDHTYCSFCTVMPSDLACRPHNAQPPKSVKDLEQLYKLRSAHLDVRVRDVVFVRQQLERLCGHGGSGGGEDGANRSPSASGDQSCPDPTPVKHNGNVLTKVLGGRLDCAHVGLLGHSFGGATALEAARREPALFGAALLMDAWTFPLPEVLRSDGITLPLVAIQTTKFFDAPYSKNNDVDIEAIVAASKLSQTAKAAQRGHGSKQAQASGIDSASGAALPTAAVGDGGTGGAGCSQAVAQLVRFHGALHQDFTDVPFWSPFLVRRVFKVCAADPQQMLIVLSSYGRELFTESCGSRLSTSSINRNSRGACAASAAGPVGTPLQDSDGQSEASSSAAEASFETATSAGAAAPAAAHDDGRRHKSCRISSSEQIAAAVSPDAASSVLRGGRLRFERVEVCFS